MRIVCAALLASALAAACSVREPSSTSESAPITAAADCTRDASGRFTTLACTGLDADGVESFAPGFELWSDGAHKSRTVYLPPGTKVDTSDMNSWRFPVGTKFWKEFVVPVNGVETKIETRMMEKLGEDNWNMGTYVWSADQTTATLDDRGVPSVPGTNGYEIPSARQCSRCHNGRAEHVLGFEAFLLAAPEAKGLTYDRLVERDLVTNAPPAGSVQVPGNAVERAAIGRLHANCGIACHNADGPAPFSMRLEFDQVGSIEETSVFREAINQQSFFAPQTDTTGATFYRIRPTDENASMIFYRIRQRGSFEQMPPVATHKPDPEMLDVMRTWIRSMDHAPYPAPL